MSNVKFRPVRGTEENILNAPVREGRIYFATDSGRMYMDKDGLRIPVGGGTSSVHYGNKVHAEPPSDSQIEFEFSIYDIEGNEPGSANLTIPNKDDLILNIPDGSFYRVLSVDKDSEIATVGRLTIAGSGGGGGGGGQVENKGKTEIKFLTPQNTTVLYGTKYEIGFNVKAVDASGATTGNGRYRLLVNNVEKKTGMVRQGDNYIDVTDFLVNESNTIQVYIYTDVGGATEDIQNRKWYINTTRLALTWDYNETEANSLSDSKYNFKFTVSGTVAKTVHIDINNGTYELTKTFTSAAEQNLEIIPTDYFQHGAVPVKMYVTADLDGTPVTTPAITKQMIFYDPSNKTPIISCGLQNADIQQYDTVQIPIVIYSIDNTLGDAQVVLKEQGTPVDTLKEVKNSTLYYWSYTPMTSGICALSIQTGVTELTFAVNVIPLGIDIEEIGDYAFKFKANEFASNNAVKEWKSNGVTVSFSDNFDWENGGLKSEEYMDRGMKRTRQAVVVKAGTSMTINYKLFEKEAQEKGKNFKMIYKTTGCYDYDATFLNCKETKYIVGLFDEVELEEVLGKTINYSKIAILENNSKVILNNPTSATFDLSDEENVKLFTKAYIEIDGEVYYCADITVNNEAETDEEKYKITWRATGPEENGVGLLMTAQTALIRSSGTKTTIPYCEDSYMEFEFDIWPATSGGGKTRLIQGWLDGVPCSIAVYPEGTKDFIQTNPQLITIGSPDCDVVIYLVKLYESHLSDEGHLTNFIADAPNAAEMLSRYKRNDILDERGEISPEKLALANPECTVHLYDVDRIPLTKKDYVLVHEYTQYLGSDQANLHATNALYRVQGTSSAAYVVAAANLDTNFKPKDKNFTEAGYPVYKPTFTDGEGKDLLAEGGWSMDDKAIPCTYFTTKVNVASCEQANNALNQEWYNQYQPYKSSVRKKAREDGKIYRDTMQFKQGVVFLKDRNKTVNSDTNTKNNVFKDTDGYVNSPYYKMYSIGSMGNSKKNTQVFHDEDNPIECCIENGDNQLPGQWMTVPQGGYAVDGSFTAVNVMVDDIIEDGNTLIMCPDGNERTAWDLWYAGMDEVYGFRYPDGRDDAFKDDEENATRMTKAWYDFVKWMALSNPNPKYQTIEIKDANHYSKISSKLYIRVFDDNGKVLRHEEATEYIPDTQYYVETAHIYGYTEEPLGETKKFERYTFSDSEYTRTLAGTTIDTYAGEYTHDTYEYRMAKMLSECEEHLVMDSIVYHYLFIERHTMIDNVAKNTFWSSSDLQHWDLTKDYDNDTADGNDNQGKLTLTYGYEIGDLRNGVSVFNAPNSVWVNFIDGLYTVRQAMYQKLDTDGGVWDSKTYLEAFDTWQNIVPERCWIEDYYRKYLRPYIVYGDSMYLEMLEGGQKKHQRNQYETYQDIYTNSEYFGRETNGSYITMRCNTMSEGGVDLTKIKIPIKVYSDCYIWGAFGSGTENPNIKSRVKRNETVYIASPISDIADATSYLFPASSFQQIGSELAGENGLEMFGLKQFSVAKAPKLSKVVLGTYTSSVNNKLLEEVGFEGNPLLRELYICGYNADALIALNLSNATGLQLLDARRSSMFSVITLANGAPVRTLRLDRPTGLIMQNLNQLQELDITDYSKLNSVNLDNIDNEFGQHSKTIAKNIVTLMDAGSSAHNMTTYGFKNINWTLEGQNEIEGSSGTPIHLIDTITSLNSNTENNKTLAFTGNVLLKHNNSYDVNKQYEIYNKYAVTKQLSKLNVEFDPTELYNIQICDGNGKPIWNKKITKGSSITADFLSSGPDGAFDLDKVMRASSQQFVYNFTNSWDVYDLNNPEAAPTTLEAYEWNGLPLWTNVKTNLRFEPKFEEVTRQYTLKFYIDDKYTSEVILNADYGTTNVAHLLGSVPHKDDSNLPADKTYSFEGFALMKNSTTPIPSTYYVQNDQTFYPLFKEVSVYENIHPEYFIVETIFNYTDPVDSSFNIENGASIALTQFVTGKITIPKEIEYAGQKYPVTRLGSTFRASAEDGGLGYYLTHVYFEPGSQVRALKDNTFAGYTSNNGECHGISHFEYPDSLRTIGKNCFTMTPLQTYNIGTEKGNLYSIGEKAYQGAFVGSANGNIISEINIASSVVVIGNSAFTYLLRSNNGGITTVNIGSSTSPSNLLFKRTNRVDNEYFIFRQNAEVPIGNINIYLTADAYAQLDDITKYIDINGTSIKTPSVTTP